VIASLKGVEGGEYRNRVLICAAIARGRLVELNATSGGATSTAEYAETKEEWLSPGHRVPD